MIVLLFNKPYRVLSQFTDRQTNPGEFGQGEERQKSLAAKPRANLSDYISQANYYPAGRLDYLSEGLILLTDDGGLQHRIADPQNKLEKFYWVQVEGELSTSALNQLKSGILLKDGKTLPAKITPLSAIPAQLGHRNPPVAAHRNANSQWLDIGIRQGKNRQIRRMLAHVGHPVLRLVRHRIGPWSLDDLQPGATRSENVNLPKHPRNTPNRSSRAKAKKRNRTKLSN